MNVMEEVKQLSETERNWAMFCHLSAFAGMPGLFFPFGSVLGPLICWLSRKDESAWVDENGKAAMNFNLSILLYILLVSPLCLIKIGFLIIGFIETFKVICIIIASVKASKGEKFKYPLAIPFIQ
jgi:uncharacterized Tic20 family protein